MPTLSPTTLVIGGQDLATCQPIPPISPIRDEPGHPVASLGGFQHRVGFTDAKIFGSSI
jgi:hypothetical protein